MRLETSRLLLRPWRSSDAPRLCEICQDKALSEFTRIPYPYTLKHAKDFLKKGKLEAKRGETYDFAIALKETGLVVGNVAFARIDKRDNRAELAYHLAREFRGRGIMPEAAGLLLGYGFKKLKLNRIEVMHGAGNESSKRVIQKLGFKFEGTLRKRAKLQSGGYKDQPIYSLLREEYLKRGG